MRSALARGWWFGRGEFVLGLNWIATAFTYQAAMPAWLGWVAVVVLSFYLAVYPAAAVGLAWRWGRSNRTALVLILAAGWIVTEYLRGTIFTGFAWNPVGVSLIETWLKWPARLIGTYGLSGLAILWAGLAQALVTRLGAKIVMAVGFVAMIAGMLWYTQIPVDGSYVSDLLPGYLLIGFALPFTFIPVSIAALAGVANREAGLASGLINTAQQIGGAIGVAVCSSVLFTHSNNLLKQGEQFPAAFTSGAQWAFWVAVGVSVAGLVATLTLIRREELATVEEAAVAA